MINVNLDLQAEDIFELADHFRRLGDRIDRLGGHAVPEPGHATQVLRDGRPVGTLSAPARLTDTDRAQLGNAERVGNMRLLHDASLAISALGQVLEHGEGLDAYTRPGLHKALELCTAALDDRAVFLEERHAEMTGGGGHD